MSSNNAVRALFERVLFTVQCILKRQPLPLPLDFDGVPYPRGRWDPQVLPQNERKR